MEPQAGRRRSKVQFSTNVGENKGPAKSLEFEGSRLEIR